MLLREAVMPGISKSPGLLGILRSPLPDLVGQSCECSSAPLPPDGNEGGVTQPHRGFCSTRCCKNQRPPEKLWKTTQGRNCLALGAKLDMKNLHRVQGTPGSPGPTSSVPALLRRARSPAAPKPGAGITKPAESLQSGSALLFAKA